MTRKVLSFSAAALMGALILGTFGAGTQARAETSGDDSGRPNNVQTQHRTDRRDDSGRPTIQIQHRVKRGNHQYRANPLTRAQVRHRLRRHGYSNIFHLRRRGDVFVARGYTNNGRHVRVFVNAWTGRISQGQHNRNFQRVMTRHDVIQLLLRSGYHNIRGPEYRNGIYVARARDYSGYRRRVHVDPRSGVIRHVGWNNN